MNPYVRVLLFDLDGTLVDSAPDLAGAANDLRAEHGLPPLSHDILRPMAGMGARGLVGAAFGVTSEDERFDSLREAFLALYARRLLRLTRVFDAMVPVLLDLESAGVRWGIVTNKAMRYAEPIVEGLGLAARAAVLIAGDSTPYAKPHPEPLLEAARRMAVVPGACAYVGDDQRDVVAGRAAGMVTLAAAWGYQGPGQPPQAWNADHVLSSPDELLKWLELA